MGRTDPNASVRRIAALVGESVEGLSHAELVVAARARYPRIPAARIAALVAEAVAAGVLTESGGKVRVPVAEAETATAAPVERPLRAVAVDLESVVRTTKVEPFTEKRIFQIGAVRLGADTAWAEADPCFTRWVALPGDEDWVITSDRLRAAHTVGAVPPVTALTDLHAFVDGADLIVVYNGTEADFPMLAQALEQEGLPSLPGEYVDAYYLALGLWPDASTYRLAHLAEQVGVAANGLSWHDAGDDAELLRRLLETGADVVQHWPAELADLVASVCPDSPGWRLVRELAGDGSGAVRPFGHAEVAVAAQVLLAGHPARRAPARSAPAGRGLMSVPLELRGADGRVDPVALASVAHGDRARRRPAQEQMTAVLHDWVDLGIGGLVEAPTGTGKSLAILAAALDWLAGGPDRNVIVATYTKQLQAQLARDVARLDDVAPGLLAVSDVVKGKSNRLSLRALLVALADATTIDRSRGPRPGAPDRFLTHVRFRELLLFLLLRLRTADDQVAGWSAHSVDPVDVPAFFRDYAGPALYVWLESLSQADAGDYAPASRQPIAAHTDLVSEALAGHRLVLANHALLLAHVDQLVALGQETLLVIDEAHQIEDAATAALTTTLDYRAVEDLHAELEVWTADAVSGRERDAVREAVGNLGRLLDHEQLPKVASLAFDARSAGVGALVGARAVTLASPYGGAAGIGRVRTLAGALTRLAGLCEAVTGALAAYRSAVRPGLDFFAEERLGGLLTRTSAVQGAALGLVTDLDAVLGPPPNAASGVPLVPGTDGDDEEADGDPPYPAGDEDDLDMQEEGEGVLPPGTPNRVVYAQELELLKAGLRRYRFRIATAPIELPADPDWRRFLTTFARTYFVSATLRVAGSWDFVRARLGLAPTLRTLHLPTPFDLAGQAEVVCFGDFPSWAEQADGAMRTVAHQLAGYAAEMVHQVVEDGEPRAGDRGGYDGGALVLTTARSTAGGLADHLAVELRRRGDGTPVIPALVRGNKQAFTEFTDHERGGGLLVGTKGLWQGVDVADPDRLRLVWINKLPFAPFADPVIEARRAAVATRAESTGAEDPEAIATERYYLPLAALQLRQAVGRLIRSERHRGVVIISDSKLAGVTALRRSYRQVFLGSLEPELLRPDPETGEPGGGNVVAMAEGWRRVWAFFARHRLLEGDRAAALSTPEALAEHTLLPQTRRIRALALSTEETKLLRAHGALADEVVRRAAEIGGLLRLSESPAVLKDSQIEVIRAAAVGRDVLGLLPTGFGKSFCFQLPALVLPGVTIVVSPLVALMHDQALELNRSIGGAVRALVAPLRESNSRVGKTEVAEQLQGRADHGIRLIYVSPERLCQARFRELVREAVRAGTVTRIAIDEAHTAVQWGDDFRPAFRRVERFLAELRAECGLPVTALTATANRTVHAGLRERVFGLPADPGPTEDSLVTVLENPIRPELAIFRRSISTAGPSTVAGLTEGVLDKIDDHAIFYCLTVKEVVALHAHLRDYLGDAGVRVRRFHGRLTEAEKTAVMIEFREAPSRGEEGFVPLIVIATSAFGLGINRPDVRTVFCVSPPTDLAALYQQIGRAGRDAAGRVVAEDACPANVGLTLITNRALRTVRFMTGQDLHPTLLARMGRAVLRCGGVLDTAAIADALIGEDLAAGRLSPAEARNVRTAESYVDGVIRVFAALADLGAVDDLGDFPPLAVVRPGELTGRSALGDETEEKMISAVLALPARGGPLHRTKLLVAALDAHLVREVPGYHALAGHPAATWEFLADLHDRGRLDVSAAPSRRFVTGMTTRARDLPPGFLAALSGKARRAAAEIATLLDFFDDRSTCANRKFADYFGVVDLPAGCCTDAENRCSACWDHRTDLSPGKSRPAVATALGSPRPRAAGARTDAAHRARRLDQQVGTLLWHVTRGLRAAELRLTLRGEDSWYHAGQRRRIRLPNAVLTSRYFGANPGVTTAEVEAALARLAENGRIVQEGHRWRDAGNVRREQARVARAGGTSQ